MSNRIIETQLIPQLQGQRNYISQVINQLMKDLDRLEEQRAPITNAHTIRNIKETMAIQYTMIDELTETIAILTKAKELSMPLPNRQENK